MVPSLISGGRRAGVAAAGDGRVAELSVPRHRFMPGGVIGFPYLLLRCSPRLRDRPADNQDSETDLLLLLRPDRFPLLVGPIEHLAGAGPAAARLQHLAAVDHDRVAVDIPSTIADQKGREVRQLLVLADTAQRHGLDQLLVAAAR